MVAPPLDTPSLRFDELEPRVRRRLIARTTLTCLLLVTVMIAAYYLIPWSGGSTRSVAVRLVLGLVLLVVGAVLSVRTVLHSPHPMLRAFEALGFVFGFAVVSFASLYVVISSRYAMAFSEPLGKTDGLYFSLTTTTTIGYGDISPLTDGARIVVMIHMVTNVAVLGVAGRAIVTAARRRA